MLHRLCGPPSIPLSFNLAAVLPRRCAYRVSCDTEELGSPTSSTHRLQRGLPGYLILFAPHAFAPQRQYRSRAPPSPPVFFPLPSSSSWVKELYNPKAFLTHAALLDQGFPHCPIFPTAASRRSLGRVSVPVWLIILSDQLRITGLVGRYPTNYLIRRGPLLQR